MLRACRFAPHSYVCLQEEPAISFEGDRWLPPLQATAPPQEEAGAVVAGWAKKPGKEILAQVCCSQVTLRDFKSAVNGRGNGKRLSWPILLRSYGLA